MVNDRALDRFYDAGVEFVFRHKRWSLLSIVVAIPLCAWLFYEMPKSRMPEIDQQELIVHVDWNENIHLDENYDRVNQLFRLLDEEGASHTAYIGQQQFLLNQEEELSVSEAELYLRTGTPEEIEPLRLTLDEWLRKRYPNAVFTFSPPATVFEKLFVTGEADLVAELRSNNRSEATDVAYLRSVAGEIGRRSGMEPVGVAFENQLNLAIDWDKLLLYRVSYTEVERALKTAFQENEIATLRSFQQYLPITVAGESQTIDEILRTTLVATTPDEAEGQVNYLPLEAFIKVSTAEDLKTLTAGKDGEYVPFSFYGVKDAGRLMDATRQVIAEKPNWEVDFSGSFFSNQRMLNELVVILLVSILLMYFILAAQFENFRQPLIVLLEIPIDVAASLLVLWVCGHTLNLMSAIGIVVTCGIIINDSILKLDAINEYRKAGMPLMDAIHEAGRRRLRPIIMTSLTTIFGMVPLLFSFDIGSELQKPLSIAMIAAMLIGTMVSLFIIPLVYWYIYRREEA